MLQQKTKGLFLEISDFAILAGVTSGFDAPLTIERLEECPADADADKLRAFVRGLVEGKGRQYLQARVGIYPKSRFAKRHTLENPLKVKDPAYVAEMLTKTLGLDIEKNQVTLLQASNGMTLDMEKPLQNQKEIIVAGALTTDLTSEQQRILDAGIFPDSLEIGSLSTLGGLMEYARLKEFKLPTLALEITADSARVFILSTTQVDFCRPVQYGLNSMFPVIQQELGLKDEESAKKLFYSNTFDFTEMGSVLLRKMLKELQASTGFYEVQTGQSIGQLFLPLLPKNLSWIHASLSRALGVEVIHPDFPGWLKALNLTAGEAVPLEGLDSRWFGLFSLMGTFNSSPSSPENGGKKG